MAREGKVQSVTKFVRLTWEWSDEKYWWSCLLKIWERNRDDKDDDENEENEDD